MTADLTLALRVHLLGDRYHGADDWPPAPARVFQALVAGAGPGLSLPEDAVGALGWLEAQSPPVIAVPPAAAGERLDLYVPNNDLDAKDGVPAAVAELRVLKHVPSTLFEGPGVVTYLWTVAPPAPAILAGLDSLARGLYQLGRGVDAAWAELVVGDREALEAAEVAAGRLLFRPARGHDAGLKAEGAIALRCPGPGSLASIVERYQAEVERFQVVGVGRSRRIQFRQAPRARFREVPYGAGSTRALYELQDHEGTMTSVGISEVVSLVEGVRDGLAARLVQRGLDPDVVNRFLIGRGAPASTSRVRLVPLPSIGHAFADHRIRRVLAEVPADCPLDPAELHRGLVGLALPFGRRLVPAEDERMLRHYGTEPARRWRSVTPVVVAAELQSDVARQVGQAARHAGLGTTVTAVRAQPAPFERHGALASTFAAGTRFDARRLWHVEVELRDAIRGPVVLGDGRFLGLGVLRPVGDLADLLVFEVAGGLVGDPDPITLARALRRAALARYEAHHEEPPPGWLHGHNDGGGDHAGFHWDPPRRRLLVVPPPTVRDAGSRLRAALEGLRLLRAGGAGLLELAAVAPDPSTDVLLAPARSWRSVTPYAVERHRVRDNAHAAVREDVVAALSRAESPPAEVTVHRARGVPGRGVEALVEVRFAVAIPGPMLLGRTRWLGGGLFAGVPGDEER